MYGELVAELSRWTEVAIRTFQGFKPPGGGGDFGGINGNDDMAQW